MFSAGLYQGYHGTSSFVQDPGVTMGRTLCSSYQVTKQRGSLSTLHKDAARINSALVVAEAK